MNAAATTAPTFAEPMRPQEPFLTVEIGAPWSIPWPDGKANVCRVLFFGDKFHVIFNLPKWFVGQAFESYAWQRGRFVSLERLTYEGRSPTDRDIMNPTRSRDSGEHSRRLDEVLAAYVDALEAGKKVDRKEWLRRYPDLADELAEFFANRDRLAPLGNAGAVTVDFGAREQRARGGASAAKEGASAAGAGTGFNYEILEELARGGMGIVYKARQVSLKRIVALKMILAGEFAGASSVLRFQMEAQAAANLDHPYIVPVYDHGEVDGNHFFTMKLIEGENLAQWLARNKPSKELMTRARQKDIARLLAKVARGVHHAHQRGVLHRDLKPGNIMLHRLNAKAAKDDLPSVIPMVTDFGLAKRVAEDGSISQSQNIVGTAAYMSPEQALGKAANLTVATDIYSLGAILYELLIGQPPFRAESYVETLYKVVHEPPVPPRHVNPRIDAELETICMKCLAKAPEERYPTAAALARDFEAWAAGEPINRPMGRTERLWRWCRRNPVVAFLSFLIATLLIGGGAYSAYMNVQLTEAADDLVQARDAAEHQAQLAKDSAALAQASEKLAKDKAVSELEARLAADKARAAENLAHEKTKVEKEKSRQLLVRQYVQSGAGLLDNGDPLGALAWFGEALTLDQGDPMREWPHRIRIASALQRSPHLLHAVFPSKGDKGEKGDVRVFCMSGNGEYLFTAAKRDELWKRGSDKPIELRWKDKAPILHAAFHPFKPLLATGHEDGQVRLWDAAGNSVAPVMRHAGAVSHLEYTADGKRLISAGRDGTVCVWDGALGKSLLSPLKLGAEATLAVASANGKRLVTVCLPGKDVASEVRVWDLADGKPVTKPLKLKRVVGTATFNPDAGVLYVSSASTHNLRSFTLTDGGKGLATFDPANITGRWFSPDGVHGLYAQGTMAQVFELTNNLPKGLPLLHGGDVQFAAFSRDGRQVVTAGRDRVVRVWDVLTGQPLTPALVHPGFVRSAMFDNAGQRLATNCTDNAVRLWDIRTRDQTPPALPVKYAGEILAVGPGGRSIFAAGKAGLKLWDLDKGRGGPVLNITKPLQTVFSPDGKHLATLDSKALRLWDVGAKAANPRDISVVAKEVQQITFSPSGSALAARLMNHQMRSWNVADGAPISAGKFDSPFLEAPPISPDGRRVATVPFKQTIRMCDIATGNFKPIKQPSVIVNAAYSPDGFRLASACADGYVRIWDLKAIDPGAAPTLPPLSHTQYLSVLAFSLDGRLLATAGSDGTARVWDAYTGLPLTPLLHQPDPVAAVSFSPEGERLATVSKTGAIRVWDLRPDVRKAADLHELTRLLSGQQMHAASGAFIPYVGVLSASSWETLRNRFPAEFGKE